MSSQPIPLFTIEEHHEAFYVWCYAAQQQLIPAAGNTLLHVDEHSDMAYGRFKYSIYQLNGHLADVRKFTYEELRIDTFISAAIARGLIDNIYWVRQKHEGGTNKGTDMYIRSYNNEGKKLIIGRKDEIVEQQLKEADQHIHHFTFTRLLAEEMTHRENMILDIDLDYFSCAGHPERHKAFYIDITKETYDEFTADPYHSLHYYFTRVSAIQEDGRYYLAVNDYDEIYREACYVTEEKIVERITLFVDALYRNRVYPVLINICRSRYSGYTPEDQWEFIEKTLLDQLHTIYRIQQVSLL